MSTDAELAGRIQEQIALVLPTLKKHFKWYDEMTGFPRGSLVAVGSRYGLLTFFGVSKMKEAAVLGRGVDEVTHTVVNNTMRGSIPNNFSLTGAVPPGSTATHIDEMGILLHSLGRILAGDDRLVQEITNTVLTGYPLESITAPGFKTDKGAVITVAWRFNEVRDQWYMKKIDLPVSKPLAERG